MACPIHGKMAKPIKNSSSNEYVQETVDEAQNGGHSMEEVFEIVEGCEEDETELQAVEFIED